MIGALGLLALSADFVANDKPYYMKIDGESYFPIAIDYGVSLGLREWPAPLVNQRMSELAKRAEWQTADMPWGEIPPVPEARGSAEKKARRNDVWRSVITHSWSGSSKS